MQKLPYVDEEYKPTGPGERALWAAVLARAICDSCWQISNINNDCKPSTIVRAAQKWIDSRNTNIQSFIYVCEVLDINPTQMRRVIKEMQRDKTRPANILLFNRPGRFVRRKELSDEPGDM